SPVEGSSGWLLDKRATRKLNHAELNGPEVGLWQPIPTDIPSDARWKSKRIHRANWHISLTFLHPSTEAGSGSVRKRGRRRANAILFATPEALKNNKRNMESDPETGSRRYKAIRVIR